MDDGSIMDHWDKKVRADGTERRRRNGRSGCSLFLISVRARRCASRGRLSGVGTYVRMYMTSARTDGETICASWICSNSDGPGSSVPLLRSDQDERRRRHSLSLRFFHQASTWSNPVNPLFAGNCPISLSQHLADGTEPGRTSPSRPEAIALVADATSTISLPCIPTTSILSAAPSSRAHRFLPGSD